MTTLSNIKEKKKIIRNNEKGIQKTRFIVQSVFAALCVWIGIEFYLFNHYLETNGGSSHSIHVRPVWMVFFRSVHL